MAERPSAGSVVKEDIICSTAPATKCAAEINQENTVSRRTQSIQSLPKTSEEVVANTNLAHKNGPKDKSSVPDSSKRYALNECIRQIYIVHGNSSKLPPAVTTPVEFNKRLLCQTLNSLVQSTTSPQNREVGIERVKRQLFRDCEPRSRKRREPLKNCSRQCELYQHRRRHMGRHSQRVRRGYLNAARAQVLPSHQRYYQINTAAESVCQVSKEALAHIHRYQAHKSREQPQPVECSAEDEQRKRAIFAQARKLKRKAKRLEELMLDEEISGMMRRRQDVLETSVRAIYYMKSLLNYMTDNEEQLYEAV